MSFYATEAARRAYPWLAWLVILGVVGFVVWRNLVPRPDAHQAEDLILVEAQARYMIGVTALLHQQEKALYKQAAEFNRGSYGQRLRYAILGGDLMGPAEGRTQLHRLLEAARETKDLTPNAHETHLTEVLDRLYEDYQAGRGPDALPHEERAQLHNQLGWFGDLALAPAGRVDPQVRDRVLAPARRTAVSLWVFFGGMLLLVGLGAVVAVVLFVLWALGLLRGRFRAGSPHGGIYAETFAVYLALFVAVSLAFRWLPVRPEWALLLNGLAALAGLLALAWPVLRGVPWRRVKADIGWTGGRHPVVEVLLGGGTYATALPMMVVGLLIFLLLSWIQRQLGITTEPPTHPLVGWVARSGWWVRLQVVFDACVVAPVVEETMFRGVLYRHLREATSRLRPALAVLASALVVSVLFAAIHPQGLLFIPVLGALAFAFCLAREWRGSLLAPMVAHGINNGVTLLLLLLMVG
jgi:membrane protease YdiL (CAAX protease family)